MDVLDKAISQITDKYKGDLLKFCSDLIKTPSVNGQNKEKAVAELVMIKARDLGLPNELISLDKDRPNVFVGADFSKKSGLLFIAHLDTVPAGDENKWKHSPFGAQIEEGKLFGRGAIDCKAGIALSIYTLKAIYDLGKPELAKFVGVVDEESEADSKLGARYLLDKGLDAEAAIYTYPGIETVTIGHRGLVRVWIKVSGEAAHTGSKSWQDGTKGANAIDALARFINSLSSFNLDGTHEAFPGYTFKHTPTIVQGGAGESIVPDSAKLLIDARLLPSHNNGKYIKGIKDLAARFNDNKIKFEVEVKTNIPGVAISPKEKIVQILRKLDKEVMGVEPEIKGSGPASEGYMFIGKGIPTICGFGAEGDGAHSVDEYLKIESLPKILEIYIRTAFKFSS